MVPEINRVSWWRERGFHWGSDENQVSSEKLVPAGSAENMSEMVSYPFMPEDGDSPEFRIFFNPQ